MFEQLKSLEDRYEKLNELLSDPEIGSDPDKLREYSKEQAGLADSVTAYRKYKTVTDELADAKEMLELESDDDKVDMEKMEIEELTDRKEKLEEEIKFLLIPKDPNDDKNVIVESRAAAGGDEAALFAGDLFGMYSRYTENNKVKREIEELTYGKEKLEEEIKCLLIPKDTNDDKNVIVDIQAAEGGDEAALFAGDLFHMYSRYAEHPQWKTEVIDAQSTGVGGYKEITFMIKGERAYSHLKFENGAHSI